MRAFEKTTKEVVDVYPIVADDGATYYTGGWKVYNADELTFFNGVEQAIVPLVMKTENFDEARKMFEKYRDNIIMKIKALPDGGQKDIWEKRLEIMDYIIRNFTNVVALKGKTIEIL